MKYLLSVVTVSVLLTACASTDQRSDSSKLLPGNYTFKGFNAEGKQLGGTVKVNVPYNDPSFAVGVLCSNKGTVVVKATNDSGTETAFRCIINGKPAS